MSKTKSPLNIAVLCRSWREIATIIYNLQLQNVNSIKEVNYRKRRIVTKCDDVITFYHRDSKLNDGIRADVLVADFYPNQYELAILRYSSIPTRLQQIWNLNELELFMEAIK